MAIAQTPGPEPVPDQISWMDSYVVAYSSPYSPETGRSKYLPTGNGQCVDFVKKHGYGQYSGNAHVWETYINNTEPENGSVVVLRESALGHLALVLAYTDDKIWVVEQNYGGLYKISYRTIDRNDPKIVGYVNRPN